MTVVRLSRAVSRLTGAGEWFAHPARDIRDPSQARRGMFTHVAADAVARALRVGRWHLPASQARALNSYARGE